jgi:Leucine Rich repeat
MAAGGAGPSVSEITARLDELSDEAFNRLMEGQLEMAREKIKYTSERLLEKFDKCCPGNAIFDRHVTRLELVDCGLDVEDVRAVLWALDFEHNDALRFFNLAGNNLGHDGCALVCDLLAHNNHIKTVSLSNNNIEDEGAEMVAQALRTNFVLEQLWLCSNNITATGGQALISAVSVNKNLRSLHVDGNRQVDTEGIGHALRNDGPVTFVKSAGKA